MFLIKMKKKKIQIQFESALFESPDDRIKGSGRMGASGSGLYHLPNVSRN